MSVMTMNPTLTPTRRRTLEVIRKYMAEHGLPPTLDEIGMEIGTKKAAVREQALILEQLGYLTYARRRARGIRLAQGPCPCCGRQS
jgi:repressor LexA